MPLLYGEGKRAFRRLQVELLKQTRDHTMFLWSTHEDYGGWFNRTLDFRGNQSFLAKLPVCFNASTLEDVRPTFLQPVAENSIQEMTALGVHITLPCIQDSPGETIAVLDCSKADNNRIGIVLLERTDGRYQRSESAALLEVSPEEVKGAITKELYILDEDFEGPDKMETLSCLFKVESLTIEGKPESDVCMYMIDTHLYKRQWMTDARAFCDKAVYLPPLQAIGFAIKFRFVNVTILCGDFYGQSWLKIVLSDDTLTRETFMNLKEELCRGLPSENPRDYAMASRGTEIRVEVHARKKLADWGPLKTPCWHMAIHIRFGPGMPSC